MGKILEISRKLNFTPNHLGSYGLKKKRAFLDGIGFRVVPASFSRFYRADTMKPFHYGSMGVTFMPSLETLGVAAPLKQERWT